MQNGGYPYMNQPQPSRQNSRERVSRRKRKFPGLLAVVLVLIGLGAGAWLVVNRINQVKAENAQKELEARYAPYADVFLPNISIDGISLSGMSYDAGKQAVENQVNSRQNSWSLALTYQGHTFITLNYDIMGMTCDMQQVYDMVDYAYGLGHSGNLTTDLAALDWLAENPVVLYSTQSEMSDGNVDSILSQIAAYFKTDPQDAYLAEFNPDLTDPFTIQSEVYGTYLDTEPVKEEIMRRAAVGESGSLEFELNQVAPQVLTADVRSTVTLLSTGITAISASSEEGRTNNIKTAFSKINGYQLADGKTFSFNTIVGKRTTKNGFYEAPEYAYGELVTGIGGGVCQASTTVYLAAVLANQKITKRTVHSSAVNYTEKGQDATVSDRGIDFCFQNTSGGTLYITAHVEKVPNTKKKYQCVVKIYGPSMGDNVYYKLRSVVVEELEPDEPEYKKDTKAQYVTYVDETYQYRKSSKGYVVDTYLQKWENGKMVEEHVITTDTYKAKNEIWYVGTKQRE